MSTPAEKTTAPLTRPWRKILCAVDFSDSSRHAVEMAAELAQRVGAELTLLHVREPPDEGAIAAALAGGEAEVQRKLGRSKLEAQQYLDGPVRSKVLIGSAADEIIEFAWEGRFDLVVTGTHGRTGMKRMVLGSVAENVVRRAPCPVMVARPMSVAPSLGDVVDDPERDVRV